MKNPAAVLFTIFVFSPVTAAAQEPPPEEEEPQPEGQPETPPEAPPPVPEPPFEPGGGAQAPIKTQGSLPPLDLPVFEPGTLAKGSQLTLVAASFSFTGSGQADNDVDDETATYSLAASARWFGSLEKETFAWSADANAGESLSRVPFGDGSNYTNNFSLGVSPEARLYINPNSQIFAYTAASFNTNIQSFGSTATGTPDADSVAPGSLSLAIGGGIGRVLSIDPIVRLRRLEQALTVEGTLGGTISQEVGTDVIRIWYALRNEIGLYKQLAYTLQRLDQAGLLGEAPSVRATYAAIQVLADPFIVGRRAGWEARGGLGMVQTFVGFDEENPGDPDTEPDPTFALVGSMQYEMPLALDRHLSIRGKLLFELGDTGDVVDPMSDPRFRPWSLRGYATYTRAFYHEDWVPLGALTLNAEAGFAGMRSPAGVANEPDLGIDVVGSIGYSRALNRGSFATLAGALNVRNDGVFLVTIDLAITWGVASGFYTPYVVPVGL